MTTVDFGGALGMLRAGRRVTRQGWNARGQAVALQKGYPDGVPANANTAEALGVPEGTKIVFRPYFVLRAADGSCVPWAPTVSDVLASDWYAVSAER